MWYFLVIRRYRTGVASRVAADSSILGRTSHLPALRYVVLRVPQQRPKEAKLGESGMILCRTLAGKFGEEALTANV